MEQMLENLLNCESGTLLLRKFTVKQIAEFSYTPLWRANKGKLNPDIVEFVMQCRLWTRNSAVRQLQFN